MPMDLYRKPDPITYGRHGEDLYSDWAMRDWRFKGEIAERKRIIHYLLTHRDKDLNTLITDIEFGKHTIT